MMDGIVHGLDETFQTAHPSLQGFTVFLQRVQNLELRPAQHFPDGLQAETQFAVEQDLLQLQQ